LGLNKTFKFLIFGCNSGLGLDLYPLHTPIIISKTIPACFDHEKNPGFHSTVFTSFKFIFLYGIINQYFIEVEKKRKG
jgi:hypothetical protein